MKTWFYNDRSFHHWFVSLRWARTSVSIYLRSAEVFSNRILYLFCFDLHTYFSLHHAVCGILVPQPEIEPGPQLWEHWVLGQSVSSVAQSCLTLCDPMDCSTPGFPVHHHLPELAQTHAHRVSDVIQSSHPLSFLSPPAFNLSQHQGLFQRVSSSHQVEKGLEFQLQHQSFQWILKTDFL